MSTRRNEWIIAGAVSDLIDAPMISAEGMEDLDRGFRQGVKALASLLKAEL